MYVRALSRLGVGCTPGIAGLEQTKITMKPGPKFISILTAVVGLGLSGAVARAQLNVNSLSTREKVRFNAATSSDADLALTRSSVTALSGTAGNLTFDSKMEVTKYGALVATSGFPEGMSYSLLPAMLGGKVAHTRSTSAD